MDTGKYNKTTPREALAFWIWIFSPSFGFFRGVQAAFLEIKSSLKPNQVVKNFSSQASNQIAVPKNCQIKPQIKSGSLSLKSSLTVTKTCQ